MADPMALAEWGLTSPSKADKAVLICLCEGEEEPDSHTGQVRDDDSTSPQHAVHPEEFPLTLGPKHAQHEEAAKQTIHASANQVVRAEGPWDSAVAVRRQIYSGLEADGHVENEDDFPYLPEHPSSLRSLAHFAGPSRRPRILFRS